MESDQWEDKGAGGWTILEWILGCDGMDWIDLAHDRERWSALVNTVINLRVP
jgi:hypothetical protein